MKQATLILVSCVILLGFAIVPNHPTLSTQETTSMVTITVTVNPDEMLVSDLDVEAGEVFTDTASTISMKVPTGWTLPPNKPEAGQAPHRYLFSLYPITQRKIAYGNTTPVLLASMQIELQPSGMIFQFVPVGQARTIHNAMQGFMALYKDYVTFGTEITDRTLGVDDLEASCTSTFSSTVVIGPAMEGVICMAAVDDEMGTLISYGAQTRLKTLTDPMFEDMLATLKLVPSNIPTQTPVLSTPTWTPAPR